MFGTVKWAAIFRAFFVGSAFAVSDWRFVDLF